MASWERAEQAIGGLRKTVQDLVAPEVSGLKNTLNAILEGQKQLREEIKAVETRLGNEIKASETRLDGRIEQSKREIILAVDNRFLREEVERLKREKEQLTQ